MKKTIKQLIEDLKWFDLIRQLKELFKSFQDSSIQPKLEAGNNITFSGEGTEQSPLKISSAGGGSGGSQDLQSVLNEGTTANINEYFNITNSDDIHLTSGSNKFQVNNGQSTYALDFTGKDFLLNSIGNGQVYTNTTGLIIDGQLKGLKINGNIGEISLDAQGNILKLSQGEILLQSSLGVKLVNSPQQDNSVTKGLARQSSGRIVEYDLSSEGTLPTGTERQVIGFNGSGDAEAVTLGWKQLSDLPSSPTFSNGVYVGTAFQPDGSALFAFIELGIDSDAKPTTIPIYNSGTVGSGGGTLPVQDAIEDLDAVNLRQLRNSYIPLSGTTTGNPVTGDIETEGYNALYKQGGSFSIGSSIDGLPADAENAARLDINSSLESQNISLTAVTEEYGSELRVIAEEGNNRIEVNCLNGIGLIGNEVFNKQNDPNAFAQIGDINLRVPAPPTTGTYTLQSINGVTSWVTT